MTAETLRPNEGRRAEQVGVDGLFVFEPTAFNYGLVRFDPATANNGIFYSWQPTLADEEMETDEQRDESQDNGEQR